MRRKFVHCLHLERQFFASDEILRFLHHHSYLLQFIKSQPRKTTGSNNQFRRLHPYSRHTEQHFVVCLIDVDRKLFGMAQSPRKFRVYFEIEIRIGIIHNFIYLELIKTQ